MQEKEANLKDVNFLSFVRCIWRTLRWKIQTRGSWPRTPLNFKRKLPLLPSQLQLFLKHLAPFWHHNVLPRITIESFCNIHDWNLWIILLNCICKWYQQWSDIYAQEARPSHALAALTWLTSFEKAPSWKGCVEKRVYVCAKCMFILVCCFILSKKN